ncbi:hypothetical protein [Pseudodesulfovibrio pelocollis]|uniref:hypothetical protein n=1 Tax=Pseudodesulfovibrio pelocollis TaxID=3051432 RepID=UPI00255ABB0A|nr:hypothetical protein [Pseudodesulfovibrio sp. SB368]
MTVHDMTTSTTPITPTLEDRLERIEAELEAMVQECKYGRIVVPEIGRICMAQFFAKSALGDMRRRREIPLGGRDRSVPSGDRA